MESKSNHINTWANKITILRILVIPPIVICLLENFKVWTLVLLGFCMITDLLDGFVARRRKEQSKLGAFLDPLADKLLLSSMFLTLAYLDLVEMWVFVVFFSRDLLIVLGWIIIFVLTGSSNIHPRFMGKLATASQMVTTLAIIYGLPFRLQGLMIWVSVAITIVSTIEYIMMGEKKLGEWG